jgi:hypothetical protein
MQGDSTAAPVLTTEQMLLHALIRAQRPKVIAAMIEQLERCARFRNVRRLHGPDVDTDAMGAAAQAALLRLEAIGVRRS